MQANTATKFLPIVSDEKKIDISLSGDDAIIKLSTWTEDLGWTCQKTLEVDAGMLDEFHHIITAARYKLNKQKSANKKAKSSNIIDFPCVS